MTEKFLLNVIETAEILRVEPNTIRVWLCKDTVIPAEIVVRLGRRTLFSREKLLEWVNAGCPVKVEKEATNGEN